jgi:hypothetical protein
LNKEDKSTLKVVEKTFKQGCCLDHEILNHIRVLPPIRLHCGCHRSCCYVWLLLALHGEHTHIIVLLLSGCSWLLKLSPRRARNSSSSQSPTVSSELNRHQPQTTTTALKPSKSILVCRGGGKVLLSQSFV